MDNFDLRKYLVENKVTTNSKMMTEVSRVALQDIADIIDTYSPEDPADVADMVGELALEHLEGENIPSGQFNAKMRTSIANILTQYNSGKLKELAAAKQLVNALKDSTNYGEGEKEQGEQKGIKIGSADGVDISVGEESSLQDTQYYIITIGNISTTVSVDVGGEPVTLEQVMSETGLSERKAQVIVNHINSQLED
jgi:hypothetical protein